MLKDNKIEVDISYRNITHYLKLGYEAYLNNKLEILTEHLPSGSHFVVDVICEICKKNNKIRYHKYLENKKRHNFYGCKSCSRQKAALTSMSKYGVDNYSKTKEWSERVEKTNIEKFGYKTNLISPINKEDIKSKLKKLYGTENFYEINRTGFSLVKKFKINESIDDLTSNILKYSEDLYDNSLLDKKYLSYRNEVRRLTKSSVKLLIENWNGLDYYSNDNISDNFNLDHNDPNYPTIDHKISIYYGYSKNISFNIISDVTNLCITKRSINSKKRSLTEEEFKLIFNKELYNQKIY